MESGTRRFSALIVEDVGANVEILRAYLEAYGCFDVEAAGNGRVALKQMLDKRYDVVFLDWSLPGLKGPEVAAQYRANEGARERTLMVATTGYSEDATRDQCKALGIEGFIPKPVTEENLRAALSALYPDFAFQASA